MLSLVEGAGGVGASLERLGDLRRRRRREMIDELVERAVWLPPPDRWLIDSVYRDGRRVAEVAAILDQSPRILRRRVRAIIRRVKSGRFAFVAMQSRGWPALKRRVARACFIEGKSQREAAGELRLSLHAVRRQCQAVDALYEAAGGRPDRGARAARDEREERDERGEVA